MSHTQAQDSSGISKFYARLYNRFFSDEADTTKKGTLLVLPALGYTPETKFAYGLQAYYAFYLDKENALTRPSDISTQVIFGGNKYKNIKLKSDLWTKANNMHYFADIKIRNFFVRFYGIGNNTVAADKDILKEEKFTSLAYAEKRISTHWYVGARLGYEQYAYHDTLAGGIYDRENFDIWTKGKMFFVGLQQSLDNRDNIFSTTKGYYFNTSLALAPHLFGDEDFTGAILKADYRHFFPLGSHLLLGINAISQNYFSKQAVPFYVMPQLGSDEMMRGYFQGRFRDDHYSALQTELRYRFIPRLSLALFGGFGEVYGKEQFTIRALKPNYGTGLRYFFDIQKNQCIRLDYGWGQKLPGEKRLSGFYFSLNEAF